MPQTATVEELAKCVDREREGLIKMVRGLSAVVVEERSSGPTVVFRMQEREGDERPLPAWGGIDLLKVALIDDCGLEKPPPIVVR